MTDNLDQQHVEWCRNLFRTMRDGGVWGIPRSGLMFKRQADALVLVAQMPHDPAMPITREQLIEQQESDYEGTREHFGAAGVTVKKGLIPDGPPTSKP